MSHLAVIQAEIEKIRVLADVEDDWEGAHSLQDRLFEDVLKLISEGCPDAQAMAAEALKSLEIQFTRWCA